ncbi:hypothetical protein INT45_005724, partial [Circinella minor]
STLLALALLALQTTYAHPHFTVEEALPGTTLNTSIAINHGCKGSPTTEVLITVPEEITSIEPIDVANFTLSIDYRNSSQQGDSGNNGSQAISGFRWSGNLDPSTPQEFAMVIGIPNLDVSQGNVTLYFPTTQTCANATVEMAGQEAPFITVTNELSDEHAGHNHDDEHDHDHDHDHNESGAQKLSRGSFAGTVGALMLGIGYNFLAN